MPPRSRQASPFSPLASNNHNRRYVIDAGGRADPQAVAMFQKVDPLMFPGPGAPATAASMALPFLGPIGVTILLGAIIAALAALAARRPRPPVF